MCFRARVEKDAQGAQFIFPWLTWAWRTTLHLTTEEEEDKMTTMQHISCSDLRLPLLQLPGRSFYQDLMDIFGYNGNLDL